MAANASPKRPSAKVVYQAAEFPFEWGVKGDNLEVKYCQVTKVNENIHYESIYSKHTFNAKDYKLHSVKFKIRVERTTKYSNIIVGIIDNDTHTTELLTNKGAYNVRKIQQNNNNNNTRSGHIFAINGSNGKKLSHLTKYKWENWANTRIKLSTHDSFIIELHFF